MKLQQPYNIELRDVLRLRREELGLTQKQLGEQLHISAMQIAHFEAGRRDIKLIALEKLTAALNLELEINFSKKYPNEN